MSVWLIPDIVTAAKEKLLVAFGLKALTDAEVARIKADVADDIRQAGGDETAVREAMSEIDRHAEDLKEQIPVKTGEIAQRLGADLFTILRWAAVGIGIVAGLYVIGRRS